MKLYFLIFSLLYVNFAYTQSNLNDSLAVFKTSDSLALAIANWDLEKLTLFGPDTSHGSLEFMGPDKILNGKDIKRHELKPRLNRFQYEHNIKSYEKIFTCYRLGTTVLPLTIGRYVSLKDEVFYITIGLVRIDEKWTMNSLSILRDNDEEMKKMLQYVERYNQLSKE